MGWVGELLGSEFWSDLGETVRSAARPSGTPNLVVASDPSGTPDPEAPPAAGPASPRTPPLEIYVTPAEVVLSAILPGLASPGHVDVYLAGPAEATLEAFVEPGPLQGHYLMRERFSGLCHRTVTLPAPVLPDGAQVQYADGVLEVRFRRSDPGAGPVGIALLHIAHE